MSNIIENCNSIITNLNAIADEKTRLEQRMNYIENECVDLLHHIEFHDFDVSDGYDALMDLKRCRQERRELKNQWTLAKSILDNKIGEPINKAMEYFDREKLYTPRVRADLFPEITSSEYVPRSVVKVVGNINTPKPTKTPVTQLVVARKGKNYKHFPNLDAAVEFVSKYSGKCVNQDEWRALMQKKLLNAINNKTEFCGYKWTMEKSSK